VGRDEIAVRGEAGRAIGVVEEAGGYRPHRDGEYDHRRGEEGGCGQDPEPRRMEEAEDERIKIPARVKVRFSVAKSFKETVLGAKK
jgi:hypothetical protein